MIYLLLTTILALAACEPVYAASVVSSGTFQAYTTQHRVTNDGTGASGTWPINVSGTSTAFATTPTVCTAQAATGVDVHGNATGCYTPVGTYSLPIATSSTLGGVKPDGASIINASGSISVTPASVGAVPTATTVNGHALSGNVTVSASDLTTGTLPHAQLPALISGDIPNNAANTTGSAAKLTTARTIDSVSFDGTANIQTATANTSDYVASTIWTPVANGMTIVGSPTLSGTYLKIGKRVFVNIIVSGTGTVASVAGTSYFSGLGAIFTPSSREAGICTNYGTDIGIGIGDLSTSGNFATPTFIATNNVVCSFNFGI